MVKTSTAQHHGYRCPDCDDKLSQDASGRGFVKHMSNSDCRFEAGERDTPESSVSTRPVASRNAAKTPFPNFSGRSIERVRSILERSTTRECVMPPTLLFNEGWLLRLAIDWFSNNPDITHPLGVPNGAKWYSEALLPTQFAARSRTDSLAEKHTHADGAIGHFRIGQTGEGDLALEADTSHFVVLEAKLNSKLSKGVKADPRFDQAARTVACMAHIFAVANVQPNQMERFGFFVIAPESQISRGVFASNLDKTSIRQKVEERVAQYYESKKQDDWLSAWFLPVLDRIEIKAISWENVAATIRAKDSEAGLWFSEFYLCCLHYNRLAA